jgi:hypothetical protein
MICTEAFFDLQFRFARRVMDLSGLPRARALLEYTNLYARFGLGRDFDPANPTWREYLAGLEEAGDDREWTYRFYLARPDRMAAPGTVATFGCFSYSRSGDDRIRLHFRNAETDGRSPLSSERLGQRLGELGALCAHVERTLGPAARVVGASWLYNLDAYRRLFPAPYLAAARVLRGRFQHMPLWGQFLDRHGEIREEMARRFLERLDRHASTDDLDGCFPLPVLAVEATVRDFRDFYAKSRD